MTAAQEHLVGLPATHDRSSAAAVGRWCAALAPLTDQGTADLLTVSYRVRRNN